MTREGGGGGEREVGGDGGGGGGDERAQLEQEHRKKHLIQRFSTEFFGMAKLSVLLVAFFCILCALPFAEPREPTLAADHDAVFWKYKNTDGMRNFTYWVLPLGLHPRCASLRPLRPLVPPLISHAPLSNLAATQPSF